MGSRYIVLFLKKDRPRFYQSAFRSAFMLFIFHVKPIRSLLIQSIPAGSSSAFFFL